MFGLRRGGDESGNRCLHVDRAPTVEQASLNFRSEGVGRPAVARGYDVEMTGKAEMRCS